MGRYLHEAQGKATLTVPVLYTGASISGMWSSVKGGAVANESSDKVSWRANDDLKIICTKISDPHTLLHRQNAKHS